MDYCEYLKKMLKMYPERNSYVESCYKDPDGNCFEFYKRLADFLNAREEKIISKDRFSYSATVDHNNCIKVEKNSELLFYLTSDQFGFSAPRYEPQKYIGCEYKYPNSNKTYPYPYWSYLEMTRPKKPESGDREFDEAIAFVANCIWNTRGLGGSFLWSFDESTGKSLYNTYRGAKSYIEDSVDLTLYEIKMFYETFKELIKNSEVDAVDKKNQGVIDDLCKGYFDNCENDNISDFLATSSKEKPKFLLLRYEDKREIFRWLMHFETFEKYVDFFCFQPFVVNVNADKAEKKYEVINIVGSAPSSIEFSKENSCCLLKKGLVLWHDSSVKKCREDFYPNKQPRIASLDKKGIKDTLTNVVNMTKQRTKKMEECLSCEEEDCSICNK